MHHEGTWELTGDKTSNKILFTNIPGGLSIVLTIQKTVGSCDVLVNGLTPAADARMGAADQSRSFAFNGVFTIEIKKGEHADLPKGAYQLTIR